MKILFQGDSITDTGRRFERGSLDALGQGYAAMVAGELGSAHPGKYTFENRGISGNRIVDLYARAKCDIWNLEPDCMSILIGINDVIHETMFCNGVSADRFYNVYNMLLEDTYKVLPDIKLILMEPFAYPGSFVDENAEYIYKEVALRSEAVKELAHKHKAVFVPLKSAFDEAIGGKDSMYWVGDGVHPTIFGHSIIKNQWLKAFEQAKKLWNL